MKPVVNRTWLRCNIPMFLDFIVAGYVLFTFFMLSEYALKAEYDYLKAHWTALPTQAPMPGRHYRYSAPLGLPPLLMNVYAAAFNWMGFTQLAACFGWVPDMVITLALSFFTLKALHTAALGDPGRIPEDYRAPEWARHGAARRPAEADGGVAINCTPATVTRQRSSHGGYQAGTVQHDPYHCGDCSQDRPLRSHHCRYCQMCIARFDHHCDWIDNCVGQRNHKCFFLFIFYIFLCIMHFVSMLWRYFANRMNGSGTFVTVGAIMQLIGLIFYAFIVFPCGLFAAFFLFNTLQQLWSDETTIEATHPNRYGKAKLALGLKGMAAWKIVMGDDVRLWLWPDLQPLRIPAHPSPVAMASANTPARDLASADRPTVAV